MTDIKNGNLNYYRYGNIKKPVIIFLHGFMGSSKDWSGVVKKLKNNFHCITIDLPGHGLSGIDESKIKNFKNYSFTIINLLKKLNIKKTGLIAYSMGGRIALYLSLKYPEYFNKIILISTSPGLKTRQEKMKRKISDEIFANKIVNQDFSATLTEWYNKDMFMYFKKSKLYKKLIILRKRNNKNNLAKSLKLAGTGSMPFLWNELKYNNVNQLILAGEFDKKFVNIANDIISNGNYFKMKIIKKCSHVIYAERQRKFVDICKKFFLDKKIKFGNI